VMPWHELRSGTTSFTLWQPRHRQLPSSLRMLQLDLMTLHRRYGHLGLDHLKHVIAKGLVHGVEKINTSPTAEAAVKNCSVCIQGKQTRRPFNQGGKSHATRPLELVHTDVCGPMRETAQGGFKYFLTLTDDYSRKVWVRLMRSKAEVFGCFKEWLALVENESGQKLGALRSDNGGEFTSNAFSAFLAGKGIKRQLTTPYTPQLNGVAERLNRTLLDKARCMMLDESCPRKLWGRRCSQRPTFTTAHRSRP